MSEGIIKALNNLDVGGQTNVKVYPITSTIAVYDTSNVPIQKFIDNQKQENQSKSQRISKVEQKNTQLDSTINNIKTDINEIKSSLGLGNPDAAIIPVFKNMEDYVVDVVEDTIDSPEGFIVFVKNFKINGVFQNYGTFVYQYGSVYYKNWYNDYDYKDGEDLPYINKLYENHDDRQQYYYDGVTFKSLNSTGNSLQENYETIKEGHTIAGMDTYSFTKNLSKGNHNGIIHIVLNGDNTNPINCTITVSKVSYGKDDTSYTMNTSTCVFNDPTYISYNIGVPYNTVVVGNTVTLEVTIYNNLNTQLNIKNIKVITFD